jgi:antitoxin YefM
MYSTYRLKAGELNKKFIKSLKEIFKNREIEIIVQDVEEDETEYLLKNEVNKEHLLKAIENVNKNENVVEVPLENLK